jgi:8-oxo-dGTP pyrophosphatase MutT (NUDIX family)
MQDAIPAATVVILRDMENGPPELLMVERAKAMAFAGGALVFPGGRIDPGDHGLAATLPDAPDDAAARIAAIRETIEETGLAIGLAPMPDADGIARLRHGLEGGVPFAELLAEAGLTLDLAVLTPFARWRPAHEHARIFDTHFYLAALPPGAPEPEVDATENVRLFWASAAAVLAEAEAGRARIIFPTRRNLERLARFASLAEAIEDAARFPVRTITPWIEQRGDGRYVCIDANLGYPVTAEILTDAMRA